MSNDDVTFQRKHEGVERDLAALEDKVSTLGVEADRLCGIHADHSDQIQAKRAEIVAFWESLTAKAKVSRRHIYLQPNCFKVLSTIEVKFFRRSFSSLLKILQYKITSTEVDEGSEFLLNQF